MAKSKSRSKSVSKPLIHSKAAIGGLFLVSFLLFAVGQWLLFTSNAALGIVLSFAGAFLAGMVYLWGDKISMPEMKLGAIVPRVKLEGVKNLKLPKVGKMGRSAPATPSWKLEPFKARYGFFFAMIVLALVMASVAQFIFRQAWSDVTLAPGAWLFLIASLLFLAGFWPWFREGLMNLSLRFKTEMIVFGVLMALAAFLRLYHVTSMPQGLFIDQGFVGYSARRILHEGWHPFYISEIFLMAYAMTLYQVAAWFTIFGENETALRTFYVFLSLLGLPLIYWTFRQLAGPRMALATLFVLAVMRWHIIFSRNQFPTIQVPLYMFATLGFLLYGLIHSKRWAFVTAGVCFGLGFYTYQGFKIMPLLLVVYTIYECFADLQRIKKNWMNILVFLGMGLAVTAPIIFDMTVHHNYGDREAQLSIMTQVKEQHSIKPFWDGLVRTSLMFNRKGDPNSRHNLQDYKMFDDVSAVLFILGLAYSLYHIKRRKYFYAVAGFFVTSLLCILTIDAAHANRLVASTPFMAFLIATPIAAVWGRVLKFFGPKAEWVFLAVLAPLAFLMFAQNWDVYFNKQANDVASWHEYAARETNVGRQIAKYGNDYDYLIAPPYMGYHTVYFLGYKSLDHIAPLYFPDALIPHSGDTTRGAFFAVEEDRPAAAAFLKTLYPTAVEEDLLDPAGKKAVYFLRVPADDLGKVMGLHAVYDRPVNGNKEEQIKRFPEGLPEGPYSVTLAGNLFIPTSENYRWIFAGKVHPTMWVSGQVILPGSSHHFERGYYPVKFQLSVPAGVKPVLGMQEQHNEGLLVDVRSGDFNSLPPFRALLGSDYHDDENKPYATEWDPILQYSDGNEWPTGQNAFVRWTGTLVAPASGNYEFYTQTRAESGLKIDGHSVYEPGHSLHGRTFLKAGNHSIEVECRNPEFSFPSFSLYWVRPNGVAEVIPNSAFGTVH